jgi:hypothetical protein
MFCVFLLCRWLLRPSCSALHLLPATACLIFALSLFAKCAQHVMPGVYASMRVHLQRGAERLLAEVLSAF